MLAALLCASLLVPLPGDSAVLLIRVLDVSDARIGGDAILITDSAGGRARHLLIDASDHGDSVAALLRRFGVDTLAAVILSHPHADHYGGMPVVLDRFPVRSFIYGGTPRTLRTYVGLLDKIADLHILAPPPDCRQLPRAATGHDINNCSVGVRLTRGAFTMLLPGDAEELEL